MRKTNQEAFEERVERESFRFDGPRQFSKEVDENGVIDNIVNSANLVKIVDALNDINEPDREIFLMHSEGLKQKQIGELTNRTQVFVCRSIKRTRAKLLLKLDNEYL